MNYIQQTLPLLYKPSYHAYDFVVSYCNLEAYNAIAGDNAWPHNRLVIIGEVGSGKSHLANIWQLRTGAVYFSECMDISKVSLEKYIIIKNICQYQDEKSLLYLLNIALENDVKLLMTATSLRRYSVPDLRSRMNATHHVFIKQPDIDLTKILLTKHFFEKQINIQPKVIEYISTRIPRSFKNIAEIVANCEKAVLKMNRDVTIPLVKSVIEVLYSLDLDDDTDDRAI